MAVAVLCVSTLVAVVPPVKLVKIGAGVLFYCNGSFGAPRGAQCGQLYFKIVELISPLSNSWASARVPEVLGRAGS